MCTHTCVSMQVCLYGSILCICVSGWAHAVDMCAHTCTHFRNSHPSACGHQPRAVQPQPEHTQLLANGRMTLATFTPAQQGFLLVAALGQVCFLEEGSEAPLSRQPGGKAVGGWPGVGGTPEWQPSRTICHLCLPLLSLLHPLSTRSPPQGASLWRPLGIGS